MCVESVALCVLIVCVCVFVFFLCFCFFQAEDGIRDLVRSRGLGDVYKRQLDELARLVGRERRRAGGAAHRVVEQHVARRLVGVDGKIKPLARRLVAVSYTHLTLADERSSVDLGGRRLLKKKKKRIQITHRNKETETTVGKKK